MPKITYEVYRQIKVNGEILSSHVSTMFNENDAKEFVQSLRDKQGNQLAYYEKRVR